MRYIWIKMKDGQGISEEDFVNGLFWNVKINCEGLDADSQSKLNILASDVKHDRIKRKVGITFYLTENTKELFYHLSGNRVYTLDVKQYGEDKKTVIDQVTYLDGKVMGWLTKLSGKSKYTEYHLEFEFDSME